MRKPPKPNKGFDTRRVVHHATFSGESERVEDGRVEASAAPSFVLGQPQFHGLFDGSTEVALLHALRAENRLDEPLVKSGVDRQVHSNALLLVAGHPLLRHGRRMRQSHINTYPQTLITAPDIHISGKEDEWRGQGHHVA